MYTIILSSSFGTIIGFVSGFLITCYMHFYIKDENGDKPIERLKNALLTFAIISVNKDDMAGLDFDYNSYNGSKYPALSGSSIENACFSYIFNVKKLKTSGWYSPNYASKMNAIQKYLDKNLSTDDQVFSFFRKVCEKNKEDANKDETE
jgi:hypothetical protein